jgi:hypothetical protein
MTFMRRWGDVIRGALVGFGLASYVFGAWIVWMLSHIFVFGVSSQPKAAVALLFPGLLMILGMVMILNGKTQA